MAAQSGAPKPSSLPSGLSQNFSSLSHKHTRRELKDFVLTEAELSQIGLLNTLSSWFFSVASGAFLYALGLYTSAEIQGVLSERANAFAQYGESEWTGGILAVAFFLAGLWAWNKRRSTLSAITKEAVEVDQLGTVADPRPQSNVSSQPSPDKKDSQT